jgi:hypothetical protein
VFVTSDANIRRSQHHVETGAGGPSVNRTDDGLPDLRIMVTQTAICPDVSPVYRPSQGPKDTLGPYTLTVLGRDTRRRRQVVTGAKVPISGASQNGGTYVPVFPDLLPYLTNLIGSLVVENVAFVRIIDRDVRDMLPFFIENPHM